jgi:LysM repeat protein
VRAHLAASEGATLAPLTRYVVRKNETLPTIARKLGVTRADLAEANYLSVKAKVQTGQSLIVPRATRVRDRRRRRPRRGDVGRRGGRGGDRRWRRFGQRPDLKDDDILGEDDRDEEERSASVKVIHRVKAGETLTSIAEKYGTTVPALKQSNHLRSSTIQTGQRLSIVVPASTATDSRSGSDAGSHRTRRIMRWPPSFLPVRAPFVARICVMFCSIRSASSRSC